MAFTQDFKSRGTDALHGALYRALNFSIRLGETPIQPKVAFDDQDNLVIHFNTPCQHLPYFNPIHFIEHEVFNILEVDILAYSINRKTDHESDFYFILVEID